MMASSSTARRFVTAGRSWASRLTIFMLAAALSAACGKTVRPVATDDTGISTRVRTALLNDREVAATNIIVTASNRIVTLSGSVRTAAERDRAVAVARQTSGVSDVRSELAVSQP
jgi:osmotically-inducible protein OsmY